jgi:uncharacterized protein (DUF1778 family)
MEAQKTATKKYNHRPTSKNFQINIRFTKEQKDMLSIQVKNSGLTMTEYLLNLIKNDSELNTNKK